MLCFLRNGDQQKKHPKSPPFSKPNPQAKRKQKFTTAFCRAAKPKKNVRNQPPLLKKTCITPPMRNCSALLVSTAELSVLLSNEERNSFSFPPFVSQCTSHLIAIRLPFIWQHLWENLGGCGHQDGPQVYRALRLPQILIRILSGGYPNCSFLVSTANVRISVLDTKTTFFTWFLAIFRCFEVFLLGDLSPKHLLSLFYRNNLARQKQPQK